LRWTPRLVLMLALLIPGQPSTAQSGATPEQRTARYLDSVRTQPSLLLAFLQEMPKGGDLHNHLDGAVYAESFIDYAADNRQCVDRTTAQVLPGPCDRCDKYTNKPAASCAHQDQVLYNSLIDAWSMRNWHPEQESGHDHFFATFDKFIPASEGHVGDMLAEAAGRAAANHLQYLELMHTADRMQAAQLGAKLGWEDDFGKQRDKLLASGLKDVITAVRKQLDEDEAKMHALLHCGSGRPDPGCDVTVRYLYQVLRGLPREQVFAQILLGYELASTDPRFVGLNLVMPEDWYVPMRDFRLHMSILEFMHRTYPKVHLTLHAGELVMGMVPPEGLRFHMRESIERAHAERIGHGVSVMEETDPIGLLREMAQRNVLVEINLTSNDGILGVKGMDHPLPVYQKYGVPVALSTDDEGVNRSNITHEYLRAVQTYGLSYSELKRMARQSLEHNFLPGQSLWADARTFSMVKACANDQADAGRFSAGCTAFLDTNEKARMQWHLERASVLFEKKH
jgi:adenosine deaminase